MGLPSNQQHRHWVSHHKLSSHYQLAHMTIAMGSLSHIYIAMGSPSHMPTAMGSISPRQHMIITIGSPSTHKTLRLRLPQMTIAMVTVVITIQGPHHLACWVVLVSFLSSDDHYDHHDHDVAMMIRTPPSMRKTKSKNAKKTPPPYFLKKISQRIYTGLKSHQNQPKKPEFRLNPEESHP